MGPVGPLYAVVSADLWRNTPPSPHPKQRDCRWSLVIFSCVLWNAGLEMGENKHLVKCICSRVYSGTVLHTGVMATAQKQKKSLVSFILLKLSSLIQLLYTYFLYIYIIFNPFKVQDMLFFAHFYSHKFAEWPRSSFQLPVLLIKLYGNKDKTFKSNYTLQTSKC